MEPAMCDRGTENQGQAAPAGGKEPALHQPATPPRDGAGRGRAEAERVPRAPHPRVLDLHLQACPAKCRKYLSAFRIAVCCSVSLSDLMQCVESIDARAPADQLPLAVTTGAEVFFFFNRKITAER